MYSVVHNFFGVSLQENFSLGHWKASDSRVGGTPIFRDRVFAMPFRD